MTIARHPAPRRAAEGGLELLGDGGLLQPITKRVVKAALEEEMAEHLGTPGESVGSVRNERTGKPRLLWSRSG